MISVLVVIRKHLRLRSFALGGIIRAVHESRHFWRLPPINTYNSLPEAGSLSRKMYNWTLGYRVPGSFNCGERCCGQSPLVKGCVCQELAMQLQAFGMDQDGHRLGKYISMNYTVEESIDTPSHSEACTECLLTSTEIDAMWDIQTGGVGLSQLIRQDYVSDVFGVEILESYNEAGYDR